MVEELFRSTVQIMVERRFMSEELGYWEHH